MEATMASEARSSTVRAMTAGDVGAVVRQHEQAFAENFMTTFGRGFLSAFYSGLIEHPEGYGCVAVDSSDEVVGFCVGGSARVQGIAREMLRRRPLAFVWPSLLNVLRSPARLPRVIRVAQGNLGAGTGEDAPPSTALLMQIAVEPALRGSGVADRLVEYFLNEMRRRGAESVSLGVEADNARAISFYKRLGFKEGKPGIFEYQLVPVETPEVARQ
jgi:ribosomal protein S18 acetylase RimI-like enzyme